MYVCLVFDVKFIIIFHFNAQEVQYQQQQGDDSTSEEEDEDEEEIKEKDLTPVTTSHSDSSIQQLPEIMKLITTFLSKFNNNSLQSYFQSN